MSVPERYWKLRLQCGHKEDWFPACHGCLDEADASLADLRSATADLQSQLEEVQLNAHVHSDHDVWVDEKHPEYFGCRTCLAAEGLEMQLEAAPQKLCGTCGGERVVDSGGFTPWDVPINVPCPECQGPLQAERMKREAAQRERDASQDCIRILERAYDERCLGAERDLQAERTKREEAERRLGEALGYAQHRRTCYSKQFDKAPCNCGLRAVLASQTEVACTYCKGRGVIGIEARLCAVCRGRGLRRTSINTKPPASAGG